MRASAPIWPGHASRPHGRPSRLARPAVAVALALAAALLAGGCVGQLSRNDDHVGPDGVRPDAREHTMAPADPAV